MIFIAAKFTVRPEFSKDWLARVSEFTQATRDESGNLWFEWSRSVDNPDQFVLIEAFRDSDAGVEHVNSHHFKTATEQFPSMLAKTPEVINFEVPGTDWFALGEMSVAG